jgi:formylmethanofuran dehydrogenase subunit E
VCSESSTFVSCMAKQTSDYGTPVHPAAVYYTGSRSDSLAIAYIRDPRNANKILARAVVWPSKETFVKLYGTSETMRITLREKLKAAGFTRDDDFSGARLRRIEMDGGAKFVMPYIDGDCQCVDDHGDCFEIVGGGDYGAAETRGYIYSNSRYTCDNCGDGCDEDDARDVQGDTWCEHCYENHTFFCERAEETYPDSHGSNEVVTMVQRRWNDPTRSRMTQTWSEDACDGDAFFCERTETYYDSRYFNGIEVTTRTARGATITETWCAEDAEGEYFTCPDCGEVYSNDFMSTTHNDDGELVCTGCAEKHDDSSGEYKFKLPPTTPTIHDHNQHVIDFHAACVAA